MGNTYHAGIGKYVSPSAMSGLTAHPVIVVVEVA